MCRYLLAVKILPYVVKNHLISSEELLITNRQAGLVCNEQFLSDCDFTSAFFHWSQLHPAEYTQVHAPKTPSLIKWGNSNLAEDVEGQI